MLCSWHGSMSFIFIRAYNKCKRFARFARKLVKCKTSIATSVSLISDGNQQELAIFVLIFLVYDGNSNIEFPLGIGRKSMDCCKQSKLFLTL